MVSRIQADMCFVAIEILHLLYFFPLFILSFFLVLDPPASIRIAWTITFVFTVPIFIRVNIRNTVNAIHDLDRTKLNPTL